MFWARILVVALILVWSRKGGQLAVLLTAAIIAWLKWGGLGSGPLLSLEWPGAETLENITPGGPADLA